MRGMLAAGLSIALYVVVQALLFHFVRVRRKLAAMVVLWALGGGLYALLYAMLPDDGAWLPRLLAADTDVVSWANGLFLYWALFAGYYQFVNMADNSVGVRSLIELDAGPPEGLTLAGLERHYPYGKMLGQRLERLVSGNFLERAGTERFRCRWKARLAAAVFVRLKRLLALGPGG